MRLIAIGDVHGHLEKLRKLLDIVKPTTADQLVFLGDYIDRGPDSKGVIDCLIRLAVQFPQTFFLRGNHEQMMLDGMASNCPDLLPGWQRLADLSMTYRSIEIRSDLGVWSARNDGDKTLESYGITEDQINKDEVPWELPWHLIPQTHIDFLAKTKLWHREGGFLFVHAGAIEDKPPENEIYTLLWSRYCSPGTTEIHVVGHHPSLDGQPLFEPGRYSLDTGAAYGRPLTACNVLTREFWQA
jgi:serine/threonine protein phosphatase 1